MTFLRDHAIVPGNGGVSQLPPKKQRMRRSWRFVVIVPHALLRMPVHESFNPLKYCNKNKDKIREGGEPFPNGS